VKSTITNRSIVEAIELVCQYHVRRGINVTNILWDDRNLGAEILETKCGYINAGKGEKSSGYNH
jgi:hypothetical protein